MVVDGIPIWLNYAGRDGHRSVFRRSLGGDGGRQRYGSCSDERGADQGRHDSHDDCGKPKPPASARDDTCSLPAALALCFPPLPVVRVSDLPACHSTPPGVEVRFRRWALHGCRREHRRRLCETRECEMSRARAAHEGALEVGQPMMAA